MKIETINSEKQIIQMACAVKSDPKSWDGWSVLHITVDPCGSETFDDMITMTVKPMIESYFRDTEGKTYLCGGRDIYVVCKNVTESVLKQALSDIRDYAFSGIDAGSDSGCEGRIYSNLDTGTSGFPEAVMKDRSNPLLTPPRLPLKSGDNAKYRDVVNGNGTQDRRAGVLRNGVLNVLLVEDDPVTRWMVGNALDGECRVTAFESAGRVFSSYRDCNPDIVLLDIGLPDNSGRDVLSWIMDNDPDARVIMLSGHDSADNIADCIGIGARGFIPKPFAKETLMYYIHKFS